MVTPNIRTRELSAHGIIIKRWIPDFHPNCIIKLMIRIFPHITYLLHMYYLYVLNYKGDIYQELQFKDFDPKVKSMSFVFILRLDVGSGPQVNIIFFYYLLTFLCFYNVLVVTLIILIQFFTSFSLIIGLLPDLNVFSCYFWYYAIKF